MALKKSLKPRKKVAAGAAGGSVVTALVAIAAWAGVDMPAEVASALVTVVSFVAAYFKSE